MLTKNIQVVLINIVQNDNPKVLIQVVKVSFFVDWLHKRDISGRPGRHSINQRDEGKGNERIRCWYGKDQESREIC